MPVYEYACESCGHVTEELRRMSDADESCKCEGCGSTKTKRAHSVAAVATTGGGGDVGLPMGGCCPCGKNQSQCGRG